MKKIKFFACMVLIFIGVHSNSYATLYTGAAYWGKTTAWYVTPAVQGGIPRPTELSEGTAQDVLSAYGTAYYIQADAAWRASDCTLFSDSGNCINYDYHWAVQSSIDCADPSVPTSDYQTCVAPEPPPPPTNSVNGGDFVEEPPEDPEPCDPETGPSSPSTSTGHPINTTNGNKTRQENDFSASGLSPLKFTRYYSSNSNKESTIGVNWRHSYTASFTANIHTQSIPYDAGGTSFSGLYTTAQLACESGWNDIKSTYNRTELTNSTAVYVNNNCLIQDTNASLLGRIAVRDESLGGTSPNPPQDTVLIKRANGNTITFTLVNSVWTAPSDTDVSLVQIATGYTLTTAQDTVEQYNLEGQLISTTDRKGMQQTLTYNATSGLLESVTDSLGKSLNFAYVGSNISTVTLPDTTQLVYTYDANNNFSTVKREDNSIKTYVYENSRFPNALTGIIDENNQRYMTFSYDTQGRAVTSELAGGVEKVTVAFIDSATSTVTDALGQLRTYRFTTINGEKKLTDIEGAPCTSCDGRATHTTYDANGYVASSTDFNGIVTTYVNNAQGLVTTLTEAVATNDERTTLYTWHPIYALPTCKIEATRTTVFSYTATGSLETRSVIDTKDSTLFATQPSKTCDAILARTDYTSLNKRVTAYTYYPDYALLHTIDGPRTDVNDVTTLTYDAAGNLSATSNALAHVTELKHYTLRGKPQTLIDANGLTTTLTYDVRGRIDVVTVGASQVTNYDFDAVGNLNKVTRPDGSFIDYDYDAAHRLTDLRDQLGNHIHYVLDALGNRTKTEVKDSAGTLKRTQTAVYNQLSQLEKTIGAATQTTDYLLYDGNGNLKHLRDPEGKNTLFGYDALNRLSTTTNALTNTSTTVYDAQDNIISVTDLRGLETTYQYDGLGNRTQQNSPDTGITKYTVHDGAGNVLTMVDANNQTTTYQYDALNRIDLVIHDDGIQTDYLYDPVNAKGRLSTVSILDATSTIVHAATVWGYDGFGHISIQLDTINDSMLFTTYRHNPVTGLLENQFTPAGHSVDYHYTAGQLTTLTVDGTPLMSNIGYDPFGPANAWIWGNGQAVNRHYNQDGQLDTYTLGQTTFDNHYTPAGNVQSMTDLTTPTNQQNFNYDALHRLKDYNSLTGSEVYDYDANSNRTLLTDVLNTTTDNYVTDTLSNKLASINGLTNVSYTYNANGNITSKLDAAGLGHRYGYNSQNRLSSVTVITADKETSTTYAHNALGQRVSKTTDTRTTLFAYGQQGQLTGVYNADGTAQEELIYFKGVPVATLRGTERFYIHSDHLGTPRRITDSAKATVWSWDSDPFGLSAANEDPKGDGIDFIFNHRFAGQYFDKETNLHYNYFRDYDPATGRYVQSDPIGLRGGLNTYVYVEANPLNSVDLYGLAKLDKNKAGQITDGIGDLIDNGVCALVPGMCIRQCIIWECCIDEGCAGETCSFYGKGYSSMKPIGYKAKNDESCTCIQYIIPTKPL